MSSKLIRRTVAGSALVLTAAMLPGVLSSPAHADNATTITVVGTSDVSDSGLIQFLTPGFKAAFPQYTLNYVSLGTGAAIAQAEAGNASALIVHAASLENQFVGSGFSLEPFGRAIFWGDYVLLGPTADPAGVMTTDQHDIVGAFQKIAAAGAAGHANFVSRGGTPGTTVQEHAIWALTSGVATCNVTAANGGGTVPSTTPGTCPAPAAPPAWYHTTGLTQGPNLVAANACNFPAGNNNCYVFTDRGTFQNLQATLPGLKIVTRDNNVPSNPSQNTLLVNSFHAYAINPAAPFTPAPATPPAINTVGATDFLNWITSPAGQAMVASYLSAGGDPPFLPDAAPSITSGTLPATIKGGKTVKLKGSVANVVPGTPPLNGVEVRLVGAKGASTFLVDKSITGKNGKFTFKFQPKRTATYSVKTPDLGKVEISTLHPIFGDLLQSSILKVSKMSVSGGVTITKIKTASPRVTISGALSPKVAVKAGKVTLLAAHPGHKPHAISSRTVKVGATRYSETWRLGRGTWRIQMKYGNSGVITAGTTQIHRVTLR